MKVTGDNITDAQIRELTDTCTPSVICMALYGPTQRALDGAGKARRDARARCAEIINARLAVKP